MTGPFGAVLAVRAAAGEMRLRVAAVAQLAVELVDEVAPVGEDQDAAGARRLDEAERGDGLAGAGGVLEPEALGGVGVLGRLADRPRRPRSSSSAPVLRLVVVGVLLVVVGSASVLAGSRAASRAARRWPDLGAAVDRRCRCRCAAPRPAARSACPRGRRPGGRRAPCRRRAWAPPRRAGARARAGTSSRAATRRTDARRRRRARRARRRARAGAASRGRAHRRAPRPRGRTARA